MTPAREPEESGGRPAQLSYPGCELLAGRAPEKVLRRIFDGDPLGMRQRCRERLEERSLLVDHEELVLRSMGWIAQEAPDYRGEPELAHWIALRIDDAIADLLIEDAEAERNGAIPTEPFEPRFQLLAGVLGMEVTLTRRACLIVNDLEDDLRHAFYALIVEGRSLERYSAERKLPKERVKGWLRRALLAVSNLEWEGEGKS